MTVFCVSSRVFQKLNKRLQHEDYNCSGFERIEDTEVPQLQEHARKLTEAGRAANSRRFLNELLSLLNSMAMWATDDGSRARLTGSEKLSEESHLHRLMDKLYQVLLPTSFKSYYLAAQ